IEHHARVRREHEIGYSGHGPHKLDRGAELHQALEERATLPRRGKMRALVPRPASGIHPGIDGIADGEMLGATHQESPPRAVHVSHDHRYTPSYASGCLPIRAS